MVVVDGWSEVYDTGGHSREANATVPTVDMATYSRPKLVVCCSWLCVVVCCVFRTATLCVCMH